MKSDVPSAPTARLVQVVTMAAVEPVEGRSVTSVRLRSLDDAAQVKEGDTVAIVRNGHRVAEGLAHKLRDDGMGFDFLLLECTDEYDGIRGFDLVESLEPPTDSQRKAAAHQEEVDQGPNKRSQEFLPATDPEGDRVREAVKAEAARFGLVLVDKTPFFGIDRSDRFNAAAQATLERHDETFRRLAASDDEPLLPGSPEADDQERDDLRDAAPEDK